MDDESRFWAQDLEPVNVSDLAAWIAEGNLVGIVDEVEGGIVAYCHADNAATMVDRMRRATGDN